MARLLIIAHGKGLSPEDVARLEHAVQHVGDAISGLACADLDFLREHAAQAVGSSSDSLHDVAVDTLAIVTACIELDRICRSSQARSDEVAALVAAPSQGDPS